MICRGDPAFTIMMDRMYEAVFDDGEACAECRYHDCQKEPHGEWLCECTVPHVTDCPGVRAVADLIVDECDGLNQSR